MVPIKWRRSEDAKLGLIGPNAVLQMLPVLEQAGGVALRDRVMAAAGLFAPPSDAGLMPEAPAARLHQALRMIDPELAPALAWAAGVRTAQYIMAHRIPRAAQVVLRVVPRPLAARLLSAAIARHAWTFAGSGRFAVVAPLVFEIADNPIVRGEVSDAPLCHWHRAVFETLFRSLVDNRLRCAEVACCATGDPACRFVLERA
ncbi:MULTISPECIES: bacteriochlorophyll 4-vinyl reductase [unclassified Yoonia]|uniref:bacteriochlorophyll 4-vinyl reductase n=1 Tax=unclassified Yoonia TaxID=2629118 RepID=UPI002AFEFDA2|nr:MULTISPECIES: bacteriochlorophyll 4-vinyl reductase [unclassified Yoonia]